MPVLTDLLSRFGLTRTTAALARKSNGDQPPIINDGDRNLPSIRVYGSPYSMPGASWTPLTYEKQAWEGYVRNSDVYAAVSLIANAAKQVRWWDGQGNSKSSAETLVKAIGLNSAYYLNSPFDGAAKLRAAANPLPSVELLARAGGSQFIEEWISSILISGNSYIEIARAGPAAPPSMLYIDNAGAVTADLNREALHEDELVSKWRVRTYSGKQRLLEPYRHNNKGDIVQSKMYSPVPGPYGMAPLTAAMLRVDMQNETQTLMKRVMQQGHLPGWIEAKEGSEWADEQVAELHTGIRTAKLTNQEMFLENAVLHETTFQPTNGSGISDQMVLSKRDIASVFHVDPALIGDTSSRTYATYRESRRGLYMEAVIPLLKVFRDAWNRTIGAELRSPLDFDRDSFDAITAAREEATDRVHKLWTSGLIMQNEGRRDLEYDPVKGGDVFYAPASFVPLSSGTEEEEE